VLIVCRLHELLLGTFRANYVFCVGDEASAHQRSFTCGADEAIVVPVTILERNESGAADSRDWFDARSAPLGEQLSETIATERFLVPRSETLSGQRSAAMAAREAFPVPRFVFVRHATASDYLSTLDTASRELFLVASGAVDFLFSGYKALGADWRAAHYAAETFLVPLSGLVLHLFRSCTEDVSASIASSSKLRVIAISAIDFFHFRSKLFIHQRNATFAAQETSFVPMFVLVRQIFRVNSDGLVAFVTWVGEYRFVTFYAVWMFVSKHVSLPRQRFVTLPATEVTGMPVLVHSLGVFSALVIVTVFQRWIHVLLVQLSDGHFALVGALSPLAGR